MPVPTRSASHLTRPWQKLLTSSIPGLSRGLQWLAVKRLSHLVRAGDTAAIGELVAGLRSSHSAAVHPTILNTLAEPLSQACLDRLWEAWADDRLASLEPLLIQKGIPAGRGSPARVPCLALLHLERELSDVPPSLLPQVAALLSDPNPDFISTGRKALSNLKNQAAVDALFQVWTATRSEECWSIITAAGFKPCQPAAVQALAALKMGNQPELIHAPPEWVPFLVAGLKEKDPTVAAQARRSLPFLQKQDSIDALCAIWRDKRAAALSQILQQGHVIASQPVELRLLTALKVGQSELVRQVPPTAIPFLVSLLQDRDPDVSKACRQALLSLETPAARDALCVFAVNEASDPALQIALQAGYRPERPEQRALFLFMAAAWPEYDAIDFDQRLMAAIYETSRPVLRHRILQQVQRSGQQHYISILEGRQFRTSAFRLSEPEIELLVNLLTENQEWSRLWFLTGELAFPWCARILSTLAASDWQPEKEVDCADFSALAHLAVSLDLPTLAAFTRSIPPAIASAVVHVHGRVNSVCFAPHRPLLAIGTGTRKLVQWNFQKAAIERVNQGFNHSIAEVAYVGNDYLVCGVRSNNHAACLIYGWNGADSFVLPGHRGAVTSLQAVNPTTLLSTGRDGLALLWNLANRQEITRREMADWPRAARVSPGGQRIALLDTTVTLLQIPGLNSETAAPVRTARNSGTVSSIGQCVVFTPGDQNILVGQRNGQVVLYQSLARQPGFVRKAVLDHRTPVVGLEFLPNRPVLVSAVTNGQVRFYRWPDLISEGSAETPEGRTTSLHISPDGSFMATGTSQSSMVLWDLRGLELPTLYSTPLAQASPEQHALVAGLLRSSGLPAHLRPILELLHALLVRRFRYDIQLDDLPQIQTGEFDILLD